MQGSRSLTAFKVSLQRRMDAVKRYRSSEEAMEAIIEIALEDPGSIQAGTLKAIVESLTLSVNIMRMVETMLEDAGDACVELDLDVPEMRRMLKQKWENIQTIADYQIAAIKADPTKAKAQVITQLTAINRRSLDILSLLEAQEAKQIEEEQAGKLTPEEEQMIQEFEEIAGGLDDEFTSNHGEPPSHD